MNVFIVGGLLLVFLLYLGWENQWLGRKRRRLPVRICVTGTRGKSSVVRLIAASLRESGRQVVAKTTGSRPMIILPDGAEKEILRRGVPSILEGRRLLELAAGVGAQVLVAEMMSVNPESMIVESRRILQPHILVITNVLMDHMEHWGDSKAGAAGCFVAAAPSGCTLFIPEEEMYPVFREKSGRSRIKLMPVPEGPLPTGLGGSGCEFSQNVRLALAVSRHLGIERETTLRGLQKVNPDFGCLRVWRAQPDGFAKAWYFVSGFAANDPESTRMVFEKISRRMELPGKKLIGLLNLRRDRADRTRQWLDALTQGQVPEFDVLALVGGHARAAARRLAGIGRPEKIITIKNGTPESILQSLLPFAPDEAVVLGMGNMGEAGEKLVSLWQEIGEPYVL